MRRLAIALLLLAACSNPLGGATDDVRVTLTDMGTPSGTTGISTLRFTVTNTTHTEITLGFCGGGTGAYLQTYENGHWSGDGEPSCLPSGAAHPVLPGGASVTDSLQATLSGALSYRIAVPYSVPGSLRHARSAAFHGPVIY